MIDMNELKERLALILETDKLNFLGLKFVGILHKYQKKDGNYYYQNYKNEEFEGITDTEGNYLYARYNGLIKPLKFTYLVPIRLVLSMPNCEIDVNNIVAVISDLFEKNTQNLIFSDFVFQTNKQKVFLEEVGAKIERQKSEAQLAYIDFNVQCPIPNWDCIDLNCEC